MARLPRLSPIGIPQHIIQRGNNRQPCFQIPNDYAAYAHWLKKYSNNLSVEIHAWVFMPNHVHLLVTPRAENGISLMMQSLGRQYVYYYNKSNHRTGTLWEGRFRSGLVQSSDYLLKCYRYIEMNPVRAQLTDDPGDYKWSSYHSNAKGVESTLLTPHEEYLDLGPTPEDRLSIYQSLFTDQLARDELSAIRESVNTGMIFGSEFYKDILQKKLGRRVRPEKAGRKSVKCDSDPN